MGELVVVDYTNWRGDRRSRRILPEEIAWDTTEWHGEAQWILWAVDQEDGIRKAFAMAGLHSWQPSSP